MNPLGAAFAASLRGIRHCQDFKKADGIFEFYKPPVPFPTPIKSKIKTIGPPSGSALQSPSGGYNIRDVSKRAIEYLDFETSSTGSYTNKIESKNNWTTFGLCSAESLGGIKYFRRFKKADYNSKIEKPLNFS